LNFEKKTENLDYTNTSLNSHTNYILKEKKADRGLAGSRRPATSGKAP